MRHADDAQPPCDSDAEEGGENEESHPKTAHREGEDETEGCDVAQDFDDEGGFWIGGCCCCCRGGVLHLTIAKVHNSFEVMVALLSTCQCPLTLTSQLKNGRKLDLLSCL